jgi:DNA-binding GntR family transcriptional regulator
MVAVPILLKMCDNAVLSEIIEQLRTRSHLVLHSHWRQPGAIKKSIEEHQKILQAIQTRSAATLKKLNEKHTRASLKSYLDYIKGFS